MATVLLAGKQQFESSGGVPLVGGKLYTYDAGTSNPRLTFQDAAGTVNNTNPIILDARGEATIFWSGTYKVVLKDALDATIWTVDNVSDPGVLDAAISAAIYAVLASYTVVGNGAGRIGYDKTLTYAANTIGDAMRNMGNYVNAAKYYSGDMGAALQAAHNALGPDGGTILVPASSTYWTLTTQAAFTKPIRLVGEGWYNSEILSSINGLTWITTTAKLDVENISFTALTTARGTCTFIQVLQTATSFGNSTIRNNFFDGAKYCVRSDRANSLQIHSNTFGCVNGYNLFLQNLINPDEGDSFISNNTFSGDATTICVYVPSTSGINFTGNKFNSGVVGHVLITGGAGNLGNFLFTNNSFEGHTDYAIKLIEAGGTLTKVLIGNNQFSSSCNNHIVVSNGVTNVDIHGNTFNDTNAGHGNGISIENGAHGVTIVGNAFHQILSAITCAAGVSSGITMAANRFAEDVTTMFVGDDGVGTYAPQREVSLSRFMSVASETVYSDAIKVKGYGTLEVKIYGIVQGVGVCNYHRRVLLSDTGITDIDAAVTSGASFAVQMAASGGYLVISVRRSVGIGTTLTAFVEVTGRGQITDFKKV
jgi:hypothetical protein